MLHAPYSTLHALAGGILIGLASLLATLATGKIPGISGLLSRLLRPRTGDVVWRLVFFAGLLLGAGMAFAAFDAAAIYRSSRSLAWMALAGLIVGFGTRLGGGCTSGHGVCGIGLGCKRSLFATVIFVAAGMATVFVLRYGGALFAR